MITKELRFLNKKGISLAGKLDLPDDGNVTAYAVYAHCFTCSMELKAIPNINSALTNHGIAVLRFDMTGIGESEGSFPDSNFSTQIEDVLAASQFLTENYESPKLMIGHSLGGSAIMFASAQIPTVKAIVTIASPEEPANLSIKLKKTKARCIKSGISETEIGGVKFNFKPQFFADIESYNLSELQKGLHIPYLIMHSTVDTYSEISNAELLFSRSGHPKSFISLDDIDHLMLKKEDAEYVGNLIAVWAGKYI